jgi:pimeloyl-ACP methyl ester carboxylesterase
MTDEPMSTMTAETPLGAIQYVDKGSGDPVMFVHGSPGGCDQGELMTRFLVAAGYRVIAPSRPGYLETVLTEANASPDAQARMELALVDALGIDTFGLMCWSGGGPSSYRLVATAPDRVTALVAIAAVSKAYTFNSNAEESLLDGRVGVWLMKEMARHSPKSLIKSTVGAEGDLSKAQLKELTEQIWDDDTKRDFVLTLAGTVAGRKQGLHNDHAQFPQIGDLGLGSITTPTLLVHGTVDADVPPDYSDHAAEHIAGAELLRVENGTHIAAWTDQTSATIHERIVGFLRRA